MAATMRSRARRVVMTAVVALVPSLFAAVGSAQVLVVPERDLEFGQLTPGAAAVVSPADVTRRAQLTIRAQGRYSVTFELPAHLTDQAGNQIPLQFAATDGRVEIRSKVLTFDPTQSLDLRINPAEQEASLFLGGRAVPAAGQPAGTYTATIVMIIVQTGN